MPPIVIYFVIQGTALAIGVDVNLSFLVAVAAAFGTFALSIKIGF